MISTTWALERNCCLHQRSRTTITLTGDATSQRPDGYAQVVAGVVETKRAAYRQFEQIIKDLNYDLPSRNPFDRVIDHNTPWRSGNDLGGASLNIDHKIGHGTLTSTTAWRYWNWDPSNDRDFTGLAVLSLSQATSKHKAMDAGNTICWEYIFAIKWRYWRFCHRAGPEDRSCIILKSPVLHNGVFRKVQPVRSGIPRACLMDLVFKPLSVLKSLGAAVFAQIDWAITERLHVLAGLRLTTIRKEVT